MTEAFFHVGGLDILWDPGAGVAVYHLPGTGESLNVKMGDKDVRMHVRHRSWIPKDKAFAATVDNEEEWRKAARQNGLFVIEYQFFLLARTTLGHDSGWYDRRLSLGRITPGFTTHLPEYPEPKLR